jgi:hypothetical protein
MRTTFALLWSFATACGGSGDTSQDASPPIDAPPPSLVLRFDRPPGGQDFDAIASWADASGTAVAGPPITLAIDHGVLGTPAVDGMVTSARATPGGSGKFAVTASSDGKAITRTAVVLGAVDDAWNQPELVRGVVNTAGWEDGASISPDGQRLVLQYLPVAIDCLLGGDASSTACKVIGPSSAPERPGMPGADRVLANGTFHNGCPSLGADPLPSNIVVAPNAEWVFARQPDGSFADPHPVYYEGTDGCLSSFGLVIESDNETVSWAFDDLTDEPPRIHRAKLALVGATTLGTYALNGGTATLGGEPGMKLALGETTLAEGNPFVRVQPDGKLLVVFDDEQGRADLMFVVETAPGSNTFTAVATIPAPVSDPNAQESQPFFDGDTLLFRRDLVVLASDWNGGAMTSPASWSTPRAILTPGGEATTGAIVVVGEPSVATTPAGKELYFIFGERLADHLNLDVGVVPTR